MTSRHSAAARAGVAGAVPDDGAVAAGFTWGGTAGAAGRLGCPVVERGAGLTASDGSAGAAAPGSAGVPGTGATFSSASPLLGSLPSRPPQATEASTVSSAAALQTLFVRSP